MSKIKWFHQIELGNGIVTPGQKNTLNEIKLMGIPDDLTGKTVLDIGAWDGFYSFEAEKRGAKRVLATDSYVWGGKTWGSKKGFELVRKIKNSKVEDMNIDIMEISSDKIGTFDLVLFLGVLYHMRHPLLALEKVSDVTKEMAIIETTTDLHEIKRPAMAFYPEGELDGDESNWIGLNHAGMEAMLKVVGFKKIKLFSETRIYYRYTGGKGKNFPKNTWPYRKLLNFFNMKKSEIIPHSRVIYHAWK
jgi:tRNA (mo5U34)-methyltransferase